eukprot:TRINITY_DN3438_c0_g1_i1.p1 TRINITY_DN3438_c0_g1~~TRINITY_DN3438_c0_g1_i1.p1  ORF type:complete len:900 (+),score=179.66 TRINITY_DN3438_c0_g1_i1:268-2700(+)
MTDSSLNFFADSLWVFAGRSEVDESSNTLFQFDVTTSAFSVVAPVGDCPSARFGHTATTINDQELFVFGGQGVTNELDTEINILADEHTFNANLGTWTRSVPSAHTPPPRTFHTATVADDGCVYIFGGFNGITFLNDLYKYEPVAKKWSKIKPITVAPAARAGHVAVHCGGGLLMIHGGHSMEGTFNDFCVFDTNTLKWSVVQISASDRPEPRVSHTMVFQSESRELLLYGGVGETGACKNAFFVVRVDPLLAHTVTLADANEADSDSFSTSSDDEGEIISSSQEEEEDEEGESVSEVPQVSVSHERGDETESESVDDAGEEDSDALHAPLRLSKSTPAIEALELSESEGSDSHALSSAVSEGSVPRLTGAGGAQGHPLMLDLIHLWNQRNMYVARLNSIQALLNETDELIQQKLVEVAAQSGAGLVVSKHTQRQVATSEIVKVTKASKGKRGSSHESTRGKEAPEAKERRVSGPAASRDSSKEKDPLLKSQTKSKLPTLTEGKKETSLKTRRSVLTLDIPELHEENPKSKKELKSARIKEKKMAKEHAKEVKKEKGAKKDDTKKEKKEKGRKKKRDTIQSQADPDDIKSAKLKLGSFFQKRHESSVKKEETTVTAALVLNLPVVEHCATYLESKLETQGIFRIPGSASGVDKIYPQFSHPATMKLDTEPNPHNVGGAFKLYLRSLQEPVIPFRMIPEAFRLADAFMENDPDAVARISAHVKTLPRLNFLVLERILRLLSLVALKSEVNMMTVDNLAIVFGPTLCREDPATETPMTVMANSEKGKTFVRCLLDHFAEIFLNAPPSPKKHL